MQAALPTCGHFRFEGWSRVVPLMSSGVSKARSRPLFGRGCSRVILNLAIWFALHVFFAKVTLIEIGPLKLWTPALSSLNWRVVALSALSGLLLEQKGPRAPTRQLRASLAMRMLASTL